MSLKHQYYAYYFSKHACYCTYKYGK